MANIARFDPFRRFSSSAVPRGVRPLPAEIKVDVKERDTAYLVTAEVPGVRKEDIHVDIDGNVVTIRAKSKAEREQKDRGRVVRSERYYGSLFRRFALGTKVDASKAQAKYADGILTLTLPKKSNGKSKR